MHSFFAAIATFFGRPSRPGQTATSEAAAPIETPVEPAVEPALSGESGAVDGRPETAGPVAATSGREDPAVAEPPDQPTPEAPPSGPPPDQAQVRGPREKRKGTAADRLCPWCSAPVQTSAAVCLKCGATLDGAAADRMAIPGLTELQPRLRRYDEEVRTGKRKRQSLLSMILSDAPVQTVVDAPAPSDADALRPPSAAVRAEMARFDPDSDEGNAPPPLADEEPAGPLTPEPPPDPAGGEQRT